ncbi:MAG: FAD:protein FMN transferase [Pedosphaera sp.]|nr:FAD:protein FMN transferase [Pedosphaera sp.]
MQTVTLARNAMATRFEIVLHGDNAASLRAAGEEALDEIVRLENQLSLYRPGSEIAQLNSRAAREAVLVSPEAFALLQRAQRLSAETEGAFDITIAPLVRCWGFMGGAGKMPAAEDVAAAREKVGMEKILLDAATRTVRFAREGVMLDLGAIGKGHAVERAAEILRDAGVTSALIHGGTSTVHAIGCPPDAECWRVAIEQPPAAVWSPAFTRSGIAEPPEGGTPNALPVAALRDEAMSVSAMWGRYFDADGKNFGHVIDPRTGQPAEAALLAAVILPSATETDALSTALLTLGPAGESKISSLRSGMRTLVIGREGARHSCRFDAKDS